MNILIGSDPEVFAIRPDGTYVSAHDLIPGTKEQPYPVPAGAVQVDGVALEFNTVPCATPDQFVAAIGTVMSHLKEFLNASDPGLSIAITPTATFGRDYFEALPDETKELGCQPDFNAYTGEANIKPDTDEPFRTGGGHIHIGWGSYFNVADEDHFEECKNLVRQLDCVLYPASLLWDDDHERRKLYGSLGSFRPKNYGVEYRPLSNAFLKTEEIQRWVFSAAKRVAEIYFDQEEYLSEDPYCRDVIDYIKSGQQLSTDDLHAYVKYLEDWGFTKCPV